MTSSTMTMSDIAELCGVSRPLVTMWRKRPVVGGEEIPFPSPVSVIGRVEHFDADDVREYLARTGRGKNPDAQVEVAALTVPEGATFDQLTSLLCLRHLVADDLAGEDLVQLAREVDPDDEFLAREVVGLDEFVGYVDGLMAVSYGAPDAWARLVRSRTGRVENLPVLTEHALDLLSPVIEGFSTYLGHDDAQLVDGSDGSSSAALELAQRIGRPVRVAGDGVPSRAGRRKARILDLSLEGVGAGATLRFDCVLGLDDAAALDRVDLLSKELAPGDIGILLGPARLLTDRIRDRAQEGLRDQQIRDGVVRSVVRLPRNLHRAAPTQNLALWVVSCEPMPGNPVAVADLGGLEMAIDSADLANDLVATLAGPRGHHFTYLVPRGTGDLIASRLVVALGVRAAQARIPVNPAGAFQDRVREVTARLPEVLVHVASTTDHAQDVRSVATLKSQGHLVLRSGSRLHRDWSSATGTVATLGVAEWDDARFDPLDLAEHAPSAQRTEPGDVVFTTSPPHAAVDPVGGHLVPSPARILRLKGSTPIGPHAVAAQINQLSAAERDVDAWNLRVTLPDEMEANLAAIADLRVDLVRRVAGLDDITRLMITGAAGLIAELRTVRREDT